MKGNFKINVGRIFFAVFVFGTFASRVFADSVSLTWDASPSTNVVGYTVHYGTTSGAYSMQTNLGNQTSVVVQGVDRRTNYFFTVTARSMDDLQSLPSNEVNLPSEKNPPQISLTSPGSSSTFVTTNSSVNLAGTASDDYGLAQVSWSNRCSHASGVASGTTSWAAANIFLCFGTNVISVTARDDAGNLSSILISIVRSEPPCDYGVVSDTTNFPTAGGAGTVTIASGSTCSWTASSTGTWLTINSPASGAGDGAISFSIATNSTCSPRSCVLTIAGKNFTVTQAAGEAAIESVSGTFSGLFTDPSSQQNSGFFTLKKGTRTSFTGSVKFGGKQFSFSGKFDPAGFADTSIRRQGATPLTLQMRLEPCSPDTLAATLSDGEWTVEFSANRAVFDSLDPAPYAGKYTIAVAGLTAEALTDSAPIETSPEGIGFATLKVSSNGVIKVTGTLGDGEKFVQSTYVSKEGIWPCYVPLYGKTGLIFGSLIFQSGQVDPQGDLMWTKPALAKHRFYPTGFSKSVAVIGSPYFPPATLTNRVLNFENGTFILGGNNPAGGLAKDVRLSQDNKISALAPGEDGLAVTVRKDVGTFSGTIKLPGHARPVKFKGGLLQNQNAGYGYFLGTNQSGELLFEPTL